MSNNFRLHPGYFEHYVVIYQSVKKSLETHTQREKERLRERERERERVVKAVLIKNETMCHYLNLSLLQIKFSNLFS